MMNILKAGIIGAAAVFGASAASAGQVAGLDFTANFGPNNGDYVVSGALDAFWDLDAKINEISWEYALNTNVGSTSDSDSFAVVPPISIQDGLTTYGDVDLIYDISLNDLLVYLSNDFNGSWNGLSLAYDVLDTPNEGYDFSANYTLTAANICGASQYSTLTSVGSLPFDPCLVSGSLTVSKDGYGDVSAVPLPAALPMLLAGLGGLGAVARRRLAPDTSFSGARAPRAPASVIRGAARPPRPPRRAQSGRRSAGRPPCAARCSGYMFRMRRSQPSRAWQRMLSGRRLDLLDPTPMDIEVEDIAHGLAFVARWNGQTRGDWPYSVAEHSLLVEEIYARRAPGAPVRWRLAALLHDAPEYVIGDMISPVKDAVGPAYGELDARLAAAIHIRFGLPASLPAAVKRAIKRADKLSAWLEATRIAGFTEAEATRFFGRPDPACLDLELHLRPPAETRTAYTARLAELLAQV